MRKFIRLKSYAVRLLESAGGERLGSVESITDSTGAIFEEYEYDAFGLTIEGDLSGNFNLGYAGKKYDASTSKYDYGFRDYSPDMARFVSVDPIRDGVNWYNYCNSDQITVDLWGLADVVPILKSGNDRICFY